MIGETVGNYRIVERLGDGGMGAVFRAIDEMLDREVAIKVLRPELARQAALIERFRQEAIALARLNHPRIATLHGLERSGDNLLMIMEYVRGETLEAIVQRSCRLPWHRAAEVTAAVLDALDHAHDRGVVHRDIKPANIMLAHSGAIKVMDFGIARVLGKSRQTQFGHAVGTPTYMAPEQLRGEEVDGRTDLYAVGAVLFELITGRMAFEADSDYSLMMKQLNEPPPPARSIVTDLPVVIDEIIQRAMRKAREERFPDASTFRQALERTLDGRATDVPVVATPPTRFVPNTPPVATDRRTEPSGIGTTRLADEHRIAETRLGGGTSTPVSPRPGSIPPPAQDVAIPLHKDWRTYLAAAGLILAIGVGIRTFGGAPDERVAADSASASFESPERSLPPEPPSEQAQPDAASPAAVAPRNVAVADPVPGPIPARPSPVPPAGEPGRKKGDVLPPPVADARPNPGPDTTAAAPDRPVASKPPARESAELSATAGVHDALRAFADAVREKRTEAGEALTGDGKAAAKWATLVREGRLSMRLEGTPEVEARGTQATASFSARLMLRSPFGGTKEKAARFHAQLTRSGDAWRVVSLRPVGSLDLQ
ncbi:MAG: Serine/threonine-protein kinase PknD [Gemmatimonadaceae bacterium]|nr:Serine/threonine-protein kinase PknD [Gemmatimonadaceae bacterium]